MFILFICLLVQFAYMCTFFLKQMKFAPWTLLDSAEKLEYWESYKSFQGIST